MNRTVRDRFSFVLGLSLLTACGGTTPPPKTEEVAKEEPALPARPSGGGASVSQELGSIDPHAVEQTFGQLRSKLDVCHKQGRERVETMAGDVKVFLRIDQGGKVKYAFFEESTLGDRVTEKCLLDVFAAANWPKPQGGEAEVRNGFGWSEGGERPPTAWEPEKVMTALDDEKDVKASVVKCKAGITGDFHVTAYVEPGEVEGSSNAAKDVGKTAAKGHAKNGGKTPGHKPNKKGGSAAGASGHGGKFKAIGVAPSSKEGAEKVDCLVDALRGLPLPSPGSYVAKVSFTL